MEPRPYISSPTIVNPIVTLNVGGTRYTTTIQTLTSNPHTLFASLLRTLPRDKEGDIFIDRDPNYFRYILDSLRQAEIQHPYANDTYDYIRLWKEIDFFRLLAPGHIWGFSRKKKLRQSTLQVSEDTFSVSKIAKSKPSISSVCGNKALNNGKYRWRIITNGITGGIIFGLVHINAFKLRKLKSTDVYGLSTNGHAYNLERYGVTDDEEDEIVEPVNLNDPVSLMKNEEELGKRVILKDESPDEDETGKDNETSSVDVKEDSEDDSDEELSPKKVRFTDDSSRGSGGKVTQRIRKEDRYLMEYETVSGVVKVYKQDDEMWYTGKVTTGKEGYYFFITMKDVGDTVRIEILE